MTNETGANGVAVEGTGVEAAPKSKRGGHKGPRRVPGVFVGVVTSGEGVAEGSTVEMISPMFGGEVGATGAMAAAKAWARDNAEMIAGREIHFLRYIERGEVGERKRVIAPTVFRSTRKADTK